MIAGQNTELSRILGRNQFITRPEKTTGIRMKHLMHAAMFYEGKDGENKGNDN